MLFKIWKFETWIYKLSGLKEGQLLPRWAKIIRKTLHPSLWFDSIKPFRFLPEYNIINILGKNISFEFLNFFCGKYKDGLVAIRRNGDWVFYDCNIGDWLEITNDNFFINHGKITTKAERTESDIIGDFIERIELSRKQSSVNSTADKMGKHD
jgi:hypothetical protein